MRFDLDTIHLIILLPIALVAALSDGRTGRIPNWLTLPPLAAAPLAYLLLQGPGALGASILGAVCCGAVPFFLFTRGAIGGGDVKLFAAIGAVAGARLGIEVELLSLGLAAGHAFARLAWEGKLVRTLLNSFWIAVNVVLPRRRRRDIPPELMSTVRMGGAVLAATLLAVADGISVPGLMP